MSVEFNLIAERRADVGKGASRRLRRTGKVPVILYGGHKDPENLFVDQNELSKQIKHEAFYSQIITLTVDGKNETAILRALQRHPYKPLITHMDLQRVSADEAVRVHIPLHFINESKCPGVALEGGAVSHLLIEVEVSALPGNLPEYIEVDLSELHMNQMITLSQLKLPEGVALVQQIHDAEHDVPVASIHHARRGEADQAGEGEASA